MTIVREDMVCSGAVLFEKINLKLGKAARSVERHHIAEGTVLEDVLSHLPVTRHA